MTREIRAACNRGPTERVRPGGFRCASSSPSRSPPLPSSGTVAAQPPAALELIDQSLGTSSAGFTQAELIPTHAVVLRITGAPGDATVLFASANQGIPGIFFQGVAIGVDPTTAVAIWNGLVDPTAPVIGPSGVLDIPFVVGEPVPFGTSVFLQALTFGPGGLLVTNHLQLTFGGEPFTEIASGTTSSHPLASAVGGAVTTVADAVTFGQFWAQHDPATPAPTVDFTTHFVVAYFRGPFTTFMTPASFTRIWRDAGATLQVDATTVIGGAPLNLPTQPYTFAEVPLAAFSTTVSVNNTFIFAP